MQAITLFDEESFLTLCNDPNITEEMKQDIKDFIESTRGRDKNVNTQSDTISTNSIIKSWDLSDKPTKCIMSFFSQADKTVNNTLTSNFDRYHNIPSEQRKQSLRASHKEPKRPTFFENAHGSKKSVEKLHYGSVKLLSKDFPVLSG